MTEVSTTTESAVIKLTLTYDGSRDPSVAHLGEVFASLDELVAIALSNRFGTNRSHKAVVKRISYASPFELTIVLMGGSGAVAAGLVLTKRVADTLLELVQKVNATRRDAIFLALQQTSAEVLHEYLTGETIDTKPDYRIRDTWFNRSERPKVDERAAKAALALDVLRTVKVETE